MKQYPIWVASLALLAKSSIYACSCSDVQPPEAFAQAHEVFAGRVIDIARLEPASPRVLPAVLRMDSGEGAVEPPPVQIIESGPMNQVTLQVSEIWKGPNTITKVVLTGQGSGECGVPFALGADYLVYTSDTGFSADTAFVDACSGTSLHFLAGAHLEFLGAGQEPLQPVLNIVRDESTTILMWQTNWTNFRLEATESLDHPVSWKVLSNQVEVIGGNYAVTIEARPPRSLFRLAR